MEVGWALSQKGVGPKDTICAELALDNDLNPRLEDIRDGAMVEDGKGASFVCCDETGRESVGITLNRTACDDPAYADGALGRSRSTGKYFRDSEVVYGRGARRGESEIAKRNQDERAADQVSTLALDHSTAWTIRS